MGRRIAPNLRNTLADPAEYELRLFYRGHDSEAAAKAAAPDDPRPKLVGDDSRHGPVVFDANYSCLWWLDEHDHAAAAQQQQQTFQQATVRATQAVATAQQKKLDEDAAKDAWDRAKLDLTAARNKLTQAQNKLAASEQEYTEAQSKTLIARQTLTDASNRVLELAGQSPVPQVQMNAAKIEEQTARLDVTNKEEAERVAKLKRDQDKVACEAAEREETAAVATEQQRHDEYDAAVLAKGQADNDSAAAANDRDNAEPGKVAKQRETQQKTNAETAFANRSQATTDATAATAADKLAKEKADASAAADRASATADNDVVNLRNDYANTWKINVVKKAYLSNQIASAEQQAVVARNSADNARQEAAAAQLAANQARITANQSAATAATSEQTAGDEPKPLAANTELLIVAENKKYRLLATDNHGRRAAYPAGGRAAGDSMHTSRPGQYASNTWLKDVIPAVPLEAEIRKISDGKCVAFGPNDVRVVWDFIDPAEELGVIDLAPNPAAPRAWMQRFFNAFKSDSNNPTSVNDNCPVAFGGLRPDAGGRTPATSLLFKAPLVTAGPVALDGAPGEAIAGVSDVLPAVDKDAKQLGVSRVFFRPNPIGGDNYRIRVRLIDGEDKPVKFRNHKGDLVESIETGPITVWRRTVFDVMVTFASVGAASIDWTMVRNAYRAAFTEVIGPVKLVKRTRDQWEAVCRRYFAANGIPAGQVNTAGMYVVGNFNQHLIPPYPKLLPLTQPNAGDVAPVGEQWDYLADGSRTAAGDAKLQLRWTHTEGLAHEFLGDAYKELGRLDSRAAANRNQTTGTPGFGVFLAKRPMAWSTVLGQNLNDRELQFVEVGDVTCTLAHEFGHAQYLSHSWTKFSTVNGHDVTWVSQDEHQVSNHDQADAFVCAMAYENDYFDATGQTARLPGDGPVRWHFCAGCLLKLRFWDFQALRGNAQFMSWIHAGLGTGGSPITLLDKDFDALSNPTVLGTAGLKYVRAVAPNTTEATVNNSGGPWMKDLTAYAGVAWAPDRPELADLTNSNLASGDAKQVKKVKGRSFVSPPAPPVDPRRYTVTITLAGANASPAVFRFNA